MLKSFFDPNGAFARGMERVWSLIVLNVLWLVCSLPVVTMGASCAALYQVLGKLIAGEDGHVARQFFRAWGENWKKATPVWLILLAVAALCGFDLYMARLNDSFFWELLAVFALQLAAMVMTFAFPLMARYENTWRNHLKNAMLVAVGHLPRMLLIWAVWAVPVGVSVFIPEVQEGLSTCSPAPDTQTAIFLFAVFPLPAFWISRPMEHSPLQSSQETAILKAFSHFFPSI